MLYKTFIIPANSPAFAENSLNKFLQEHLIVSVTHEFSQPNNSWNFLVEYLENNNQPSVKKKIDYINICTKEDFALKMHLQKLMALVMKKLKNTEMQLLNYWEFQKRKTQKFLFNQIVEFKNLELAFYKASKRKHSAMSYLYFRKNKDSNILQIKNRLISGNYNIGNYKQFKIYEPKERNITAAPFDDRVIHHAIITF